MQPNAGVVDGSVSISIGSLRPTRIKTCKLWMSRYERLAQAHPEIAELVTLRHFVRLTTQEAASVLKIAPRTADSWWAYARAWLAADMAEKPGGEADEPGGRGRGSETENS